MGKYMHHNDTKINQQLRTAHSETKRVITCIIMKLNLVITCIIMTLKSNSSYVLHIVKLNG